MYYLYILECADKTLYTGITTDLERRVIEHGEKKLGAKYTCVRRPVKLKYCQKFKNRSAASKEEVRIRLGRYSNAKVGGNCPRCGEQIDKIGTVDADGLKGKEWRSYFLPCGHLSKIIRNVIRES